MVHSIDIDVYNAILANMLVLPGQFML